MQNSTIFDKFGAVFDFLSVLIPREGTPILNINHLLPEMMDIGSDIIDINYMMDFGKVIDLSEEKCSISGHVNPVQVLLQGTPEEVKHWTNTVLKKETIPIL